MSYSSKLKAERARILRKIKSKIKSHHWTYANKVFGLSTYKDEISTTVDIKITENEVFITTLNDTLSLKDQTCFRMLVKKQELAALSKLRIQI